MSWNKFDSLDCRTWPEAGNFCDEVFWKITITDIPVGRGIHLVSGLSIHEGRPTVWDPLLVEHGERHPGGYRFVDKDTETVYWMKIPSVDPNNDVLAPTTKVLVRDDDFSW